MNLSKVTDFVEEKAQQGGEFLAEKVDQVSDNIVDRVSDTLTGVAGSINDVADRLPEAKGFLRRTKKRYLAKAEAVKSDILDSKCPYQIKKAAKRAAKDAARQAKEAKKQAKATAFEARKQAKLAAIEARKQARQALIDAKKQAKQAVADTRKQVSFSADQAKASIDLESPKKSHPVRKFFFLTLGLSALAGLVYLVKELFAPTGGAWVPHDASYPYLNEPLADEELDELFNE